MSTTKDMLSSKKFRSAILASIAPLGAGWTGAMPWPQAILAIVAIWITYLGAQGFSDGLSGGMTSSQPGTPSAADLPKA